MRICFASLLRSHTAEDPRSYLDRSVILRALPQALAVRGHAVDVVVAFHSDDRVLEQGVTYHFVRPGPVVEGLSSWLGRKQSKRREPAFGCIRLIRALRPDAVHFLGTILHLNLWLLLRSMDYRRTPVLLHHHGGEPAGKVLSRSVQRANFRSVTRLLISTMAHARPFIDCGMIDPGKIVPFIGTSSTFRPGSKSDARAKTAMRGDPVFLWTGRLHPVKDPMTALLGFERIRHVWQDARLYMYYASEEMLDSVQGLIAERPLLKNAVDLRGYAARCEMETIYQSADFFLQASNEEAAGFALAEAMACGVIPVVTNISSFSRMTDDGDAGILFPPGQPQRLADEVLKLTPVKIAELSTRVRQHFEKRVSFPALAEQLERTYVDIGIRGACAV